MTAEPETKAEPENAGFHLEPRVAKAFLTFSGGFWQGETKVRAWFLTLALAASLIASTYITVQMNHWNRWFFDALEKKDVATVKSAILVFFLIVACMAAIGVCIVLTRETLQVRWREWLVKRLLDTWLGNQRFYHLNATGKEPPNPEYRISDDTRWATEILVDLGIGLLSAVTGGIAFIAILWSVGGAITIGGVNIPGYMVWLALAYGVLASLLMATVGKPLVGRVGTKNEAEGYFRFAMMRLRENAESIALMRGHKDEGGRLGALYDGVVERWLKIVKSHGHVTWITNTTGPMIPIIPLLFAAPKYLAGDLTLGQVTQLAAAFVQVQIAISWLVDNYNRIAEWYASARRVMDVVDASADIDTTADTAKNAIRLSGDRLTLKDVVLTDRDGNTLLSIPALSLARGQAAHIMGDSGSGKSSLLRVLGGLAAPTSGAVTLPAAARILVAPQKPYIPLGSLRDVLAYPNDDNRRRMNVEDALRAVDLSHLTGMLDKPQRWDQSLSAGERQRLGLARALVHGPDVLLLDDGLSAVNEVAQSTLLAALRRGLPDTVIVSLGQKPAPASLNAAHFQIVRGPAGAILKPLAESISETV